MDSTYFLLNEAKKKIENSFLKDGWLTIYSIEHKSYDEYIFCALVTDQFLELCKKKASWEISPGQEGKPAVYGDNSYRTYDKEGIEPFIFVKHFIFSNGSERYVDLTEEFVLYFKLFERGSKSDRNFYFIDDLGDLIEVVKIKTDRIQVKFRFLQEYLAIRQMNFILYFDYMAIVNRSIDELNVEPIDNQIVDVNKVYFDLIRPLEPSRTQHWIRGKLIFPYNLIYASYHSEDFREENLDFITGYDHDGNEVTEPCTKTNDNIFKLTFFKKEVLDKYYSNPNIYEVDGTNIRSNFFTLKIDNDIQEYVPVFLTELSALPYKEQLHWKQYNISPQEKLSNFFIETMIKGNWGESYDSPDLFFKSKLLDFNNKWENKFGWVLYKPLAPENSHYFKSLHVPTKNNLKTFCEQILGLVIITIDSLNERELSKAIKIEFGDKGINKLEKFLLSSGMEAPDMFEFLRNLQDLRSGLVAHRFSSSNSKVLKAMKYFGISEDDYINAAREIFVRSVYTLNTLEKLFIDSGSETISKRQ